MQSMETVRVERTGSRLAVTRFSEEGRITGYHYSTNSLVRETGLYPARYWDREETVDGALLFHYKGEQR